jgi:hypothetical protein
VCEHWRVKQSSRRRRTYLETRNFTVQLALDCSARLSQLNDLLCWTQMRDRPHRLLVWRPWSLLLLFPLLAIGRRKRCRIRTKIRELPGWCRPGLGSGFWLRFGHRRHWRKYHWYASHSAGLKASRDRRPANVRTGKSGWHWSLGRVQRFRLAPYWKLGGKRS